MIEIIFTEKAISEQSSGRKSKTPGQDLKNILVLVVLQSFIRLYLEYISHIRPGSPLAFKINLHNPMSSHWYDNNQLYSG